MIAAVQVALTFALLVGAGLFVRSFWQLARVDPGYQARGAVTLRYDLPASDYPDSASVARLTDALGQGLRALPGVQSVGETSNLPLGSVGMEFRAFAVENGPTEVGPAEVAPPGLPPPPPPPLPPGGAPVTTLRFFQAVHVKVGPGFFDAMQIPFVAGRDFTTARPRGAPASRDREPGVRRPGPSRRRPDWPPHSTDARHSLDDRRGRRRQHPAIRP